jgi:hypothetical protein
MFKIGLVRTVILELRDIVKADATTTSLIVGYISNSAFHSIRVCGVFGWIGTVTLAGAQAEIENLDEEKVLAKI